MPANKDLPLTAQFDPDEDEGGEWGSGRWLISYADLITTLMVLFLALYAMQLARHRESEIRTAAQPANTAAAVEKMPAADQALLAALATLRQRGEITIVPAARGVEIGINAKILFNAGDATLLPESLGVLSRIAEVLRATPTGNILVEGHTDSTPISNAKFASNWELSSARAGAVVRYLVERGIEPHRLAAIGRADNFPLVAGNDPAGRALNRRVTLIVQR
ncbi:OmpA/MotB family protein [Paraburkholderia silvatlantica]|uniref:Chemotaxis protein MotB n=1 Tax=Paraburkholderia silvatlantica TaxID=321895 RepID=A0ABR6FNP9_9BURK|nr:OmpA family protein [Paraburkholderia silvatlantica]MBB2928742.1 chemotaxis protein MotB [Paraburkholderia silvatlantica]PVY35325.1 chemotaxis protein MotB [Paraburkholderia silvatlantica]PXW40967.1 chemotaxis protein MotB [Paraburkholderia silvatlantica]TDQ98206.1 chemotaxis protein MotB [Paraburkholderia silvatlantica]